MNVGGFGIWNFIFWDLFGLCEHEPMGVGVVGGGYRFAWVVGVIGIIGLRLAVHRHQVHTPALSGPCSAALHTARPPFGCFAEASQAVMVLGRCPSPAVRPL